MEEYKTDMNTIKNWPVLSGDGHIETATRAAHVLLKSEDVMKTVKFIYCDVPFSALLRSGFHMMITYFDAEVKKCISQQAFKQTQMQGLNLKMLVLKIN